LINNEDIYDGSLKKESVIIVPKLTAIDASLKENSFDKVKKALCVKLDIRASRCVSKENY